MTEQPLTYPLSKAEINLDYDLAIVGGGIVGATLAAALKASGLKIAIIEAQPLPQAAARRRAYALSLISGRILEGIGVWDSILPHIGKFSKIRLSDADHPQVVKFHTTDLATDYLGYVGDHQVILTALQEFIGNCPNITWLCPAAVTGVDYQLSQATLSVNIEGKPQQIRTKLVIGADGPRSPIRTLAGIKTRGWKYWQSCVTFTIKHQASQNDIAFERFWPTGPMGILPLPGNRCQIVWTSPHARAKALQELDEAEFLTLLEKHTGGLLGKIELDSERLVFPVQLMQSDRYVLPRLALVGDAAHCCHPVGGQGLNLGIRDVAALAQVLQEAYQRGEDIGDVKVLERYETWRKPENLAILGVTDFLDRVFSNNWLPVVAVRRLGIWMMCRVPFLKTFALQVMTGLKGRAVSLSH
ncbi:FAD-dependent hydroxylase [Gloeothece verrucosa]|uniref:Ubiquinone biosynthesis hydroxylase, UbiH/UbiF/VisC/COQ6 family n=1 Tax=Gloeothece verrucosa (strain PCC 7822) TaxID=497965 RepID=E0UC08_GLOV7|nr:FAD-dependent hydroxylase [Gloeothece verrucosa]ADN16346.1 Ubiquinone biosynthesis hydroxylase, UbiH/UbiF/VisC/COQ6 family [Gloeothece verrucosa PCC 7822]